MPTKKLIKKPRKKKTIKQIKFIDKVLETWNATEAADQVYNCKNRKTAQALWSENLSKHIIKKEIEDRLKIAKNMIYTIATTSEKDETKLRACQDIINRTEWLPVATVKSTWDDGWPILVKRVG